MKSRNLLKANPKGNATHILRDLSSDPAFEDGHSSWGILRYVFFVGDPLWTVEGEATRNLRRVQAHSNRYRHLGRQDRRIVTTPGFRFKPALSCWCSLGHVAIWRFSEVRTPSWAPGPTQTEMLQEAREWSGSEWMRQRPILEGSLKDTFCNQLKHVASSAEIKGHRTIYKLQCSGV